MLRVMHVISDSNVGGAGVLLCHLLRHLDRTLFTSTVLLPAGSALTSRLAREGAEILLLPAGRAGTVAGTWEAIRAARPAILHTHACLPARAVGRMNGVPVCLYTRHCAVASPLLRTPPLPQLQRRLFPLLADCAVATGEAAREALLAEGVPRERICLIPNGVPPARRTGAEAREKLRGALGFGPDCFVVGMVARMEEVKGPDILLRAAVLLLRRYAGYRFLFVGTGRLLPLLRRQAAAWGIGEAVRFCGFTEDPDEWRNLFDVTVCPSRASETTPLAVAEGFSLGIPAVVAEAGSAAAMLRSPRSPVPRFDAPVLPRDAAGLAVPPGDAAALAEAVERLRTCPTLYAAMACSARERYAAHYTAARMGRAYSLLYRELLAEKGVRISG